MFFRLPFFDLGIDFTDLNPLRLVGVFLQNGRVPVGGETVIVLAELGLGAEVEGSKEESENEDEEEGPLRDLGIWVGENIEEGQESITFDCVKEGGVLVNCDGMVEEVHRGEFDHLAGEQDCKSKQKREERNSPAEIGERSVEKVGRNF